MSEKNNLLTSEKEKVYQNKNECIKTIKRKYSVDHYKLKVT